MTLSYGGVSLTLPTPRQVAWLSSTSTLRRLSEFSRVYWPGPRTPWLTFPGLTPDEPLKLGCLHWPRGASRFATFFAVVTDADLALVRTAGAPLAPLPLVMAWGDEAAGTTPGSITTSLWMLPAIPLTQIGGSPGHSLLTLVDDRYWWWFKSEGVVSVTEGTTTWDTLYASLVAALGITFSYDAISADYLKPSGLFTTNYEYLPLLLDAVAYNVGQRIVRHLDGTVVGRSVQNGAADVAADLALPAARSLMAGGAFLPADVSASIPANVVVSFPTSAGPTAPLAVTEPTGGTAAAVKQFHGAALSDGTNTAALTALAVRIGLDFGAASLQLGDWKYAGIVPWVPDPLHDAVEWVYTAEGGPGADGEVSTRIIPAPWNDLTDQYLYTAGAGSSTGTGVEVVNLDGTQDTNPASIIKLHNDQGTAAFGRLHTTNLGGGVARLDWQGQRLYKSGTGYVGPEPDLELIAGTGISITIADDSADARVQATITSAFKVENADVTQVTNPCILLEADNDLGTAAFGRIHTTDLGGGAALLDWQGLRLYKSGTGYVGPEPDIEFIAGTNVTISIADDVADERVQVTISAAAAALTGGNVALLTNYAVGATYVSVGAPFPFVVPATGTYLFTVQVAGGVQSAAMGQLWISARLNNITAAAVPGSSTVVVYAGEVVTPYVSTAVLTAVVLATAGDSIDLEATTAGPGTPGIAPAPTVYAAQTGAGLAGTILSWVKIA